MKNVGNQVDVREVPGHHLLTTNVSTSTRYELFTLARWYCLLFACLKSEIGVIRLTLTHGHVDQNL